MGTWSCPLIDSMSCDDKASREDLLTGHGSSTAVRIEDDLVGNYGNEYWISKKRYLCVILLNVMGFKARLSCLFKGVDKK